MKKLLIETPARLHFGILNPFSSSTRRYISLGVGIDRPNNVISVHPNQPLSIEGCRSNEVYGRIKPVLDKYDVRNGRVVIEECIPRHIGLGSTTQLLLGVIQGLFIANGIDEDILTAARIIGLGSVSGVGSYVFKYGGFVLDTGISGFSGFPGLMMRLDFPYDWRFIVVLPKGSGLDEEREQRIFTTSEVSDVSLVREASFILVTKLIPSIIERDYESFVNSLEELQITIGEMFKKHQGGVFSNASQRAVSVMKALGLRGVGQSSWGPTVYSVAESSVKAEYQASVLRSVLGGEAEVFIAKPRNKGVSIKIIG